MDARPPAARLCLGAGDRRPATPGDATNDVRCGAARCILLSVPPATDPWPAPAAPGPVDAVVTLPGSKSMTNRALVLAALAEGDSVVRRPLRSRDTELMAAGLRTLGAEIRDAADGAWRVSGPVGDGRNPGAGRAEIDVGNAGTVARFLPPVAAFGPVDVVIDGDPRMRERPLRPLLEAMRALGASVDDGGRGALPVTVHGRGAVRGGAVTLDASASSQLVSGLLLAAPRYEEGVRVRHVGPPLPSAPHLAMTVAMLRDAGAVVDDSGSESWSVAAGPLHPLDTAIEPDLSSAAPFLAAAMVTAGRVRIPGWPQRTTQPGTELPGLLERMGATYVLDDDGLELSGPQRLHGLDADLRDCGELAPVLTALAALARTRSRLRGIGHLRLHETDRLGALARELAALGGDVRETADGLAITPRRLRAPAGGCFRTYADHRLAMAAAVLGLAVPGVLVEDVATTAKTLPGFVGLWDDLLTATGARV